MLRFVFGMDEECIGMLKEDLFCLNEYYFVEFLFNISVVVFKISGCDLFLVNGVNFIYLFFI